MTTVPIHSNSLLVLLFLVVGVSPAVSSPPVDGASGRILTPWIVDGDVDEMAVDGSTLYIAGSFDLIGPPTGCAVPVSLTTGQPLATFPVVEGTDVYAVEPDGSGGWFIGGAFSRVGGESRLNLAHILADGSVDPTWNPSANDDVDALALHDGVLYIGGYFDEIDSMPRENLAAVDATTGTLTSWNPGANRFVSDIEVAGSVVYVAGRFDTAGGTGPAKLAALSVADGTPIAGFQPNISALTVIAIEIAGDEIFLGGSTLTSVGGQPRGGLAAVKLADGAVTPWNPNADGIVDALVIDGSTVYIGGGFDTVGGASRSRLAAVGLADGLATSWDPSLDARVFSLEVADGTVYAGGSFRDVGGADRQFFAAIDAATGLATALDLPTGGTVDALAAQGDVLYVGGTFSSLGGDRRRDLAAIDLATAEVTDWSPTLGDFADVAAMAVGSGTVYLGGEISEVNGTARSNLAAIDSEGNLLPWAPEPNGVVTALEISGSAVLVGGDFSMIGGAGRSMLAAVDAGTGAATPWAPVAPEFPLTISASPTTAYTYQFGKIDRGGGPAPTYLAYDLGTGVATAWNPTPDAGASALQHDGNEVLMGGSFANLSGQPRDFIGAVDEINGDATSWAPTVSSAARDIAVTGNAVFLALSGTGDTPVLAVERGSGDDIGWDTGLNLRGFGVATDGSTVAVDINSFDQPLLGGLLLFDPFASIFRDGFESGSSSAWSASVGEP